MKGSYKKLTRNIIALICLLPIAVFGGDHGDEGGVAGTFPGYMPLSPALVVNLATARKAKFLRVDMQFFIETNEDAAAVTKHMPAIRDRLIELLGGRDPKSLETPESRENLRLEIQTELQKLLNSLARTQAITAVYFTGFIIQ